MTSAIGRMPRARALAARRSGLLGMVTEIVTSSFGPEAVRGAQDQAWNAGMFLMIAASEGRPEMEALAVERLLEQRVEGLIFASGPHQAVTVPAAASELPTVLLHCFDADRRLPAVLPDEEGGGYVATRRLLDAGHRRIGLVNLEAHTAAAQGRLAGYIKALAEAGIAPDPALITHATATSVGGYESAAKLLDLPQRPTAVFCCTDRMAMGAYDAIKERGLSIPGDVAVVGFDNQLIISALPASGAHHRCPALRGDGCAVGRPARRGVGGRGCPPGHRRRVPAHRAGLGVRRQRSLRCHGPGSPSSRASRRAESTDDLNTGDRELPPYALDSAAQRAK